MNIWFLIRQNIMTFIYSDVKVVIQYYKHICFDVRGRVLNWGEIKRYLFYVVSVINNYFVYLKWMERWMWIINSNNINIKPLWKYDKLTIIHCAILFVFTSSMFSICRICYVFAIKQLKQFMLEIPLLEIESSLQYIIVTHVNTE